MRNRATVITITLLFLLAIAIPALEANAWTAKQEYIKNPAKVNPLFGSFHNPIVVPGESRNLSFTLNNTYNDTLQQIELTVDIFSFGTIKSYKKITDISNPPTVSGQNPKTRLKVNINQIGSGVRLVQNIIISTSGDTEEGTYFIRFNFTFTYQGERFTFLSREYFSDTDWEYATANPGDDISKINITHLYEIYHAIGIIPSTAFTVRNPIPMWPFYLLIAITILFAALAVIFYLQEEHNKFPRLEKTLQKWTGKFYQSRRLFKKRVGKTGGKV